MVTPYEVVTDSNVKLELELALGLMVNIIHEHDEGQNHKILVRIPLIHKLGFHGCTQLSWLCVLVRGKRC